MPDPNSDSLNKAALVWLEKAHADAPSHHLHLLSLAMWGMEEGVEGDWPTQESAALRQQVEILFGWKAENATAWLLSNPNGPDKAEQQADLLAGVSQARNAEQAAALVLNAIYSRQVADNPALQPAASELS